MAASLKARFRARLAADLAAAEARFEGCFDLVLVEPPTQGRLDRPTDPTSAHLERTAAWRKRRREQGKADDYSQHQWPIQVDRRQDEWPDDLRPPFTVEQALNAFQTGLDSFAAALAADVEYWAGELVKPELRKAVTGRSELVDRWPILDPDEPRRLRPYLARRVLLSKPATPDDLAEQFGTRAFGMGLAADAWDWPGEVAPLEAAAWVRPALNRLYPPNEERANGVGDALVERVQLRRSFLVALTGDNDRLLPSSGIALLFFLESECQVGSAPFDMTLISVDKPAVAAMSGLAGSNPRIFDGGKAVPVHDPNDDDKPLRIEIEWEDGSQLELDLYGDTPTLEAVGRKYGDPAVRDLLTVVALTWAGRKKASESLWWWPDEHLELVGLSNNKDNRGRLNTWLSRMSRARLSAYFRKGSPSVGPLISVIETAGPARLIKLHSGLYRGVATETGLGSYWWAMPTKVLAEPADSKVHVLAPVFGQLWRQAIRGRAEAAPKAQIGTARLMERLAIRRQKDRNVDSRAADQARKALDAGKRSGLVGDWWVERGSLEHGTGTIYATPGQPTLDVLPGARSRSARVSPPPLLPSTGAELRGWIQQKGLSSADAAKQLGSSATTVRGWTSRGDRPLPAKARKALRNLLWAG